jgi:hypothetical protein
MSLGQPFLIFFTDDSNLFFSGSDFDNIVVATKCVLDEACSWFKSNKLSIN